jgi:hypothetical protein
METNDKPPEKSLAFSKKWIIGAALTILLGAIGSGVWDVLAKPGLGWLVTSVLKVAGFFSQAITDLPYSSAALDPSTMPSVILLGMVQGCFFAGFGWIFVWIIVQYFRYRKGLLRAPSPPAPPMRRSDPFLLPAVIALIVLLLGTSAIMLLASTVISKAMKLRQVWEANFVIMTAHVPQDQVVQLRARFAALTSKADYQAFTGEARRIAQDAKVTLRSETNEF